MLYLTMLFSNLAFPVISAQSPHNETKSLDVLFEWKTMNYTFPSLEEQDKMICNGSYIPSNVVPWDVTYWHRGCRGNVTEKVFVTTPAMFPGVPVSLSTVDNSGLLRPYPDWTFYRGNCTGIHSAFVTRKDQCNRLWVLDSGMDDVFYGRHSVCPPKLFVFDLNTDTLIKIYEIPEKVLTPSSALMNMVLDTKSDNCCDDMYVYIADVYGFGLVVFDPLTAKFWRVCSNFFYPWPTAGRSPYNGSEYNVMMGLYSMALSPESADGRFLYVGSRSSYVMCYVDTSAIQNSAYFPNCFYRSPELFTCYDYSKSSQTRAMAMDSNSVLFFDLLNDNTLSCWNSMVPFDENGIVNLVHNDSMLQFISSMKIDKYRDGEETLFLLNNNFQSQIFNTYNVDAINFRILKANTAKLINGTSCDNSPSYPSCYCPVCSMRNFPVNKIRPFAR